MSSRLFGCISNQPQRLGEALAPVRPALAARGPIARWGVGYVQGGEVLLSQHPREVPAATGLDFYPVVSRIASDYVIGAADLDDGLRGQANTQPFRFRRFLFAQENLPSVGDRGDEDATLQQIAARIPDFLRRNLRGRSSGELFFHVFLAMLHDAGQLDDVGAPHARRALRDAHAFVSRTMPAGSTRFAGNVVVTNSREMIAVRFAGPMFLRRLKQQTDPRRPESQFRSVLVVSAASNPGEGFEELPPRCAVTIARDVSADLTDLDA
jgi:hypothetical protein